MSAKPTAAACPEHWQLFELVTEGSTELNAHVKQHVEAGCTACSAKLSDIQTIERARVMKDEFDAFFDELPSDDAPVEEREKFLSQFKRKSRPADRLGRLSFDGRQIAAEIVTLAGEQGIEAAKARLAAIEGDPARGYALLYAAQLAMPKVSSDPAMYVELAKAIASASRSLPFLKDKGPAQPVCREQVMGEAQLLESNALNYLGKCAEARTVAQTARVSFVEAGEDSFALALVDYFEGSAASFEGDWTRRVEAPPAGARGVPALRAGELGGTHRGCAGDSSAEQEPQRVGPSLLRRCAAPSPPLPRRGGLRAHPHEQGWFASPRRAPRCG